MRKPTMSIRTLLAVVAFIALACVALVRGNYIWASSMFTAALAVISFAVLAVIFRRGAKQAFWIGFALFGWGYLWMAHWPPDDAMGTFGPNDQGRWRLQQEGHESLVTTQLLYYFYSEWLPAIREPPPPTPPGGYGGGGGFGGGGFGGAFGSNAGGVAFGPGTGGMVGAGGSGTLVVTAAAAPVAVDYPALHEFMRVGHSLFVIMFAFVGGLIAVQLYNSREHHEPVKREPLTSV